MWFHRGLQARGIFRVRSLPRLPSPPFWGACEDGSSRCKKVGDSVHGRITYYRACTRFRPGSGPLLTLLSGGSGGDHPPDETADSGLAPNAWFSVHGRKAYPAWVCGLPMTEVDPITLPTYLNQLTFQEQEVKQELVQQAQKARYKAPVHVRMA